MAPRIVAKMKDGEFHSLLPCFWISWFILYLYSLHRVNKCSIIRDLLFLDNVRYASVSIKPMEKWSL